MDCFVCRKHRGELVMPGGVLYQDDLVFATHGSFDGADTGFPGVLFVEPRRHVPGMAGLTRAEAERIGWVTSRLARALEACTDAQRTYVEVLGHHVPHLHVWIIPRYPDAPAKLWGVQLVRGPQAPQADEAEVAALCERLREHLAAEDAD